MVQTGFGGPDVLGLADVPVPSPGPADVLVRVAACGLNQLDVLQRRGDVRLPGLELPHVAGMDVAGVVEAAGEDSPVPVGARVVLDPSLPCGACPLCHEGRGGHCPNLRILGATIDGGLAEFVLAPASAAHVLPEGIDLVEAACLPTPWATAYSAVVRVGRLRAGETLLVHAAAGNVGLAAVQIAQRVGAHVVATVGSPEKAAALAAVGVKHVVVGTEDAPSLVAEVTDGRGADVVLEYLGPATWAASMSALRIGGRLVFLGNTTGDQVTFSLSDAFHRGLELLGAGGYLPSDMAAALQLFADGGTATVAGRFALEDAGVAQDLLCDRSTVGRVLVIP
ncbi:zinc-binding dehydrogenase [Blastococcus sp. TF02A-26]|uniref:zinc-binding dehydrogenase n=1 Tax=Blastococcus sp. TF02A-26 TaxID=2250577 RepID=UPI001F2B6AAE|nr:zinc-binding dehydrogenase [Blastococcus sp. TF02A-26]